MFGTLGATRSQSRFCSARRSPAGQAWGSAACPAANELSPNEHRPHARATEETGRAPAPWGRGRGNGTGDVPPSPTGNYARDFAPTNTRGKLAAFAVPRSSMASAQPAVPPAPHHRAAPQTPERTRETNEEQPQTPENCILSSKSTIASAFSNHQHVQQKNSCCFLQNHLLFERFLHTHLHKPTGGTHLPLSLQKPHETEKRSCCSHPRSAPQSPAYLRPRCGRSRTGGVAGLEQPGAPALPGLHPTPGVGLVLYWGHKLASFTPKLGTGTNPSTQRRCRCQTTPPAPPPFITSQVLARGGQGAPRWVTGAAVSHQDHPSRFGFVPVICPPRITGEGARCRAPRCKHPNAVYIHQCST